jgi:hypothetical protein
MKLKVSMLALLAVSAALVAQDYSSPLRITQFDRSISLLTWTNRVCANRPVYEMLRTTTVTGGWQHFFFVTNASSATLTNSQGTGIGGVFHKLRWAGDTPMVFSYQFDEGYGAGPCVSGELRISLANLPAPGTWQCQENGLCFDGLHPTGNGNLGRGWVDWTASPHRARFFFNGGPEGTYLEGILQGAITNSQCVYTGMVGTVYESGFAGTTELGTFTARRTE